MLPSLSCFGQVFNCRNETCSEYNPCIAVCLGAHLMQQSKNKRGQIRSIQSLPLKLCRKQKIFHYPLQSMAAALRALAVLLALLSWADYWYLLFWTWIIIVLWLCDVFITLFDKFNKTMTQTVLISSEWHFQQMFLALWIEQHHPWS